jgi:hypothetical protein
MRRTSSMSIHSANAAQPRELEMQLFVELKAQPGASLIDSKTSGIES